MGEQAIMRMSELEDFLRGHEFEVVFLPRKVYCGRALRPDLAKHSGTRIRVRALWLMESDELYPGEWALGPAGNAPDVFGRQWIASGDVRVITQAEANKQS